MRIKVRYGSRIICLHDSSKCRKCKCYIEFYRKLKRRKSSSREKSVKYRGIISYCRFILSVEVKSTHFNDLKKQSYYDWPGQLSFDCIFNEWSVKREIREKANQYKYSGIKVKIDDTNTEQPKTNPALLVCKEQTVDETNKINFAKGSPSSNNHVEDRNHSSSTRYSKISRRKSYWRAAKDNAAKINISTKESVRTRKRKSITEDLETNGNYEDDLYAKKKFFKIPNMSEENSIGSEILDIATPAFPLTPKERSISPSCEDCYDITELNNCRKGAEKYFRRNKKKWKKQTSSVSMKDYSSPNERSETEKTKERLLETIERLKQVKKDQDNEDSNSDNYFSDLDDEKEYN